MALNRCENIAPSMAKVYEMKSRLAYAKNASKLLQRKAKVFDLLLRDYSKDLIKNTENMRDIMREAFIELAAAKYFSGNFSSLVEQCVEKQAEVRVDCVFEKSLARAKVFNLLDNSGPNIWVYGGLSCGGQQIEKTKKIFHEALNVLIHHANLRNIICSLDEARLATMRKAMIIEHITLPRLYNTISYIKEQLDDMEREDMYRLKKIKSKIHEREDKLMMEKIKEETKSKESIATQKEDPIEAKPEIRQETSFVSRSCLIEEEQPLVDEPPFQDGQIEVSTEDGTKIESKSVDQSTFCELLDKKYTCKCGNILNIINSVCTCEITSNSLQGKSDNTTKRCCKDKSNKD